MNKQTHQTLECPYCDSICEADWVDVGVGFVQCGPYHCIHCEASQIGPYDEKRELSEQEKDCGWYAPHSEAGSSVNVVGGKIVSANTMDKTYRREFVGNPRWHDQEYVDNWKKEIRISDDPE